MSKIFWVGCFPSSFRSVGDHAQTLAISNFLKVHFGDYEIKRFTRNEIEAFFKEPVNQDDLIFIHSSGDFGDLYPQWHDVRKQIIARYPNNKIVQLPVSVHYSSVGNFEVDKIFFSGRRNVLVLCRTFEDLEILHGSFDCRVEFFPDFVFYLKPKLCERKRSGVLGVFRKDDESLLRPRIPIRLRRRPFRRILEYFVNRVHNRKLERLFKGAYFSDVQISGIDITDANREAVINDCLKFYSGFDQVVSDRFHALVFAYLTKTPFVAVKSRIKQKTNVYPFLDYSCYFDSFRDLIFAENSVNEPLDVLRGKGRVFDTVLCRRSIRKWDKKEVESWKLKQVVESAVFAPSAANLQATKFKIVASDVEKRLLCENTSLWFRNSLPGAAVLVFYDSSKLPKEGWTERFIWQDTSCAMQNMMLVAEELGLKSCWASVNPKQAENLERIFRINNGYVLACMLFLGYSDQKVTLQSRHQGRIINRNFEDFLIT